MKKFINDPYQVVEETIGGIVKAYPHHLRMTNESPRALVRADAPIKGKVGICTGGGSGHIPVFLGYVGPGLCDGVSIGRYIVRRFFSLLSPISHRLREIYQSSPPLIDSLKNGLNSFTEYHQEGSDA